MEKKGQKYSCRHLRIDKVLKFLHDLVQRNLIYLRASANSYAITIREEPLGGVRHNGWLKAINT